jgi:hypothetical protein
MLWDKKNKGSVREISEAFNFLTRNGKGWGGGTKLSSYSSYSLSLIPQRRLGTLSEFQLPKS